MKLLQRIRDVLCPHVDPDVQRDMDTEGIRGIHYASYAVTLVMALALVVFLSTRHTYDAQALISLFAMTACFICCIASYFVSRAIMRNGIYDHRRVVLFNVVLFCVMSGWGIAAAYERYMLGAHMLTFFSIMMIATSVLICKPWLGILLMGSAYGTLFLAAYTFDGAVRLGMFSYVMLTAISMTGMTVRYHVQRSASQRAMQLEYMNRHDGLTGLLNRKALEEDIDRLLGKQLVVSMVDVNYFKEINDMHGHLVGDKVLRQTGDFLKKRYGHTDVYRFGGDEFLIFEEPPRTTDVMEACEFAVDFEGESVNVVLSIGSATGRAQTKEELHRLVQAADKSLYEAKAHAHGQ
ncbi:MAG: diguanylate cyclase [Atopobiaceae bacterium]|nr:diguanylate cyclase [Atopobiaceae bacterium]